MTEIRAATVLPARAGDTLSLDGAPYRGLFEVRAGEAAGTVSAIDIVNMEDYLRGVVPWEMNAIRSKRSIFIITRSKIAVKMPQMIALLHKRSI